MTTYRLIVDVNSELSIGDLKSTIESVLGQLYDGKIHSIREVKMKTVRIFDIEWETDGESPPLPSELKISLPNEDANTEHLLSFISDTFGWLVLDMKWEVVD